MRTLVLFPGALGDAICVEPAIRHLAQAGPVEFVARAGAAEVARLFPARPTLRSLDEARIGSLFAPMDSGADAAPGWLDAYERVVSFTGANSSEFRARARAHRDARVVPFPARDGADHAIDLFAIAVGAGSGLVPRLAVRHGVRSGRSPRVLCVHPGASGAGKRFPVESWSSIIADARAAGFARIRVLLGPLEVAEVEIFRSLADEVVLPPDAAALADQLVDADAMVGCDSGPGHVAAALGRPTTILFRTTDARRFGPRGPRVRHLQVPSHDVVPDLRAWLAGLAG